MPYQFETLAASTHDGILDVVLNRPEKRNAITHLMQAEIDLVLDEAEVDDAVHAVILRGAGKVFSAGHDLMEQSSGKSFPDIVYPRASPSVPPALPRAWYFRKPLIAGVHGFAGAYAVALVGCCDFAIAAEGTRFSLEIFRLSSTAPDIGWLPLYHQLPMRVIKKLFLMGGWMGAKEALQFQFVQRVVPEDQLVEETERWARQAALIPTVNFGRSKETIHRTYELMGLAAAPSVLSRWGPPPPPSNGPGFAEVVEEKGLKEALRQRDANFDDDVSRV
jgi:enoyl-CoA hydratase/carnithine racemase